RVTVPSMVGCSVSPVTGPSATALVRTYQPPVLRSCPTRRSSDLTEIHRSAGVEHEATPEVRIGLELFDVEAIAASVSAPVHPPQDRKSTRLNSSHVKTSYAVFCLKKNGGTIGACSDMT